MKELRVQHQGRPYRVLYAFDPRRCATLLIGGDKTGTPRWYREFIPIPTLSSRNTFARSRMRSNDDGGMMGRPFSELYDKMSPERRARVDALVREDLRKMALDDLRRARKLTQTAVAAQLHIDQGAVSKIEKRADMYLSTLRSYVEAVGGKLELRAVFPTETVDLVLSGK